MKPVGEGKVEELDVYGVKDLSERVIKELKKVVVGKVDIIRHLLIGLYSNGHILSLIHI